MLLLAALYVAALTLIVLLFSRLPNLEQMAGEAWGRPLARALLGCGCRRRACWVVAHAAPNNPSCALAIENPWAHAHSRAWPPACHAERHVAAAAGAGPEGQLQLSLAVPHSFDELRAVRRTLELYRQNYAVHVAALLVAAHVLLQVRGRAALPLLRACWGCCRLAERGPGVAVPPAALAAAGLTAALLLAQCRRHS